MKKSIPYMPIFCFMLFFAFTAGFYLSRVTQSPIVQITRTSSASATAAATPNTAVFPIDINTACQTQLIALPGIGEVTAEKIVTYRTENGPFLDVNELIRIDGIGQKKLDNILPYIIIGGSSNEDTGR